MAEKHLTYQKTFWLSHESVFTNIATLTLRKDAAGKSKASSGRQAAFQCDTCKRRKEGSATLAITLIGVRSKFMGGLFCASPTILLSSRLMLQNVFLYLTLLHVLFLDLGLSFIKLASCAPSRCICQQYREASQTISRCGISSLQLHWFQVHSVDSGGLENIYVLVGSF